MSMEPLGGNLPAGGPVAVYAGGRTHVFAIDAGQNMMHWNSADGITWAGPVPLLFGGLPVSYPTAFALSDGSVHVLAIGAGGPFSGGPLIYWRSPDGLAWPPPAIDPTWPLAAGVNGLAATSAGALQLDAFAVTNQGVVRYSWNSAGQRLAAAPLPPEPNMPRSVPAAVSAAPNTIDVFAIGSSGEAVRWHGNLSWARTTLMPPAGVSPIQLVKSGFRAITPSPGIVELFAITAGGHLTNWTFGPGPTQAMQLTTPGPLPEGLPAAVVARDHIEVFAIGPAQGPFAGGPLLRWRRDGTIWSGPVVIGANLAAGGVGTAAGGNRVDVFAINAGGNNNLQHWPAGVSGCDHDPWINWASNQSTPNPAGHCRPSTLEDLVAIVKTAEKLPGARVRAVGSSWSFSDIAKTLGFVVETNAMTQIIEHVIKPNVLTAHAPAPRHLIHVEAGIQVNNLMLQLDQRILAPFTMGGSSGQTLAGVISTSVHGADVDRGPIVNMVRAIHLVGAGGVQYWIEPDQWRITDANALQQQLGPDVQIHYDDDMFDSVLVSVGALGLIYSVVLEVTEQYFLIESCEKKRWSEVRGLLVSGDAFPVDKRFVQIAVDPGGTGDRWCYITTRKEGPVGTPVGTSSPGPLEVFCEVDLLTAVIVVSAASALASAVLLAVIAVFPPAAPIGLVPALAPPLYAVLKAGPPGTLMNFVGSILNMDTGLAASTVSYLTDFKQPTGIDHVQGLAHKIMGPLDLGQCASRGLGIELAFDTRYLAHINFLDEMMGMLDSQLQMGNVLGGWISLRFVGPSRAVLSPQRSARTCMIEIVSIDGMKGTKPILDAMEVLGAKHGATPHWGMFSSFSADRVMTAFPRLDTFRSVRFMLTAGGTIHTFDNQFTHDKGLEDPPSGTPLLFQTNWRWCQKCMSMVFAGDKGRCAAGKAHDTSASGNYGFPHNVWSAPGARNWRWCNKCQELVSGDVVKRRQLGKLKPCPAGGSHVLGTSDYTVLLNGQQNWRWCSSCQSLAYAPGGVSSAPCPAGGVHNHQGSGDYWIKVAEKGDPGQKGWGLCNRCQGMTNGDGKCIGGVAHDRPQGSAFALAFNAPEAPGQAHWRACGKCGTLVFGNGACFAGGIHDLSASGDYTLITESLQGNWRHCGNCQSLWFGGAGGLGVCSSSPRGHDKGANEYFVAVL